jgi:SAM-dependent methyltransferase
MSLPPSSGLARPPAARSASFRDPSGRIYLHSGRVLRVLNQEGGGNLDALLGSAAAARRMERGQLVRTRRIDGEEKSALLRELGMDPAAGLDLVEHERIAFPVYPYEFTPEMLYEAGLLTVELALALLEEGLGLKDATPYNVLFRGAQPVFVDALSVERRDPLDPVWLPYAQWVRTFLLPLAANKYFGMSLQGIFTTRRDGLEPEELYRMAGLLRRLRPGFFSLVTLPALLGRRKAAQEEELYRERREADPAKARFVLQWLLRRARRDLQRLAPRTRSSNWSQYYETLSYSDQGFRAKREFLERVLGEARPRRVLDLGCNTGMFSALAARGGAAVVAADCDPVVVGEVYRTAQSEPLDITPLVLNLGRPSPALGWRNSEQPSFLERARGGFDMVFMLALIHHLMVSERVPLEEVVDLAAELTTGQLIIEYVAREDAMFRRLCRGRQHLHADFTREAFTAACRRRFEIVESTELPGGTRALYRLRKRG